MPPKRDKRSNSDSQFVTNREELKSMLDELRSEIRNDLQTELQKCCKEIASLRQENSELKRAMQSQHLALLQTKREMGYKNLIFTGIPENTTESTSDTINKILCDEKIIENPVTIKNAVRLGRNTGTFPRLLKITFKSRDDRDRILKNGAKLRNSRDVIRKKIYINPDLPTEDRRENKRLRLKMKELRQQHPSDTFVLRKGILSHNGEEIDRSDPTKYLFRL